LRFTDNEEFSLFTRRPDKPIPGGQGTAVMLGRVISSGNAIGVGKFLLVNPVSVMGAEVEGGAAVLTTLSNAAIAVYFLGPHLTQPGELLICRRVDHRWVAERGTSQKKSGHTLPGCPCTELPDSLFMHVKIVSPLSLVVPAALTYMSRPADLSVYSTDPVGYYSAKYTSSDGLYALRFWFSCIQGVYYVWGLFTPDSVLGYPGIFRIMSWLVGLGGNTCNPISLTNGATDSGNYRAQGISINGVGPA
jgi:hypothetical protein